MVPQPPAEPQEINAFTTITRLTFLQTQNEQVSNTCTQPMYSDLTLANQNRNSLPQNQNIHSHNQSTVILQQFSMITQELRNFTKCPVTLPKSCKHAQQLRKILVN